jgi:dihydroxyacetone kinase
VVTPLADDPARFTDDVLDGFVDLYADQVRRVPGGVVRTGAGPAGRVAVVVGGGSGHYPAFCGLVGPGLADGAVVGNVFTSPSTADAVQVASACAGSAGVLLLTGNYAGDVLNFRLARDELRRRGVPAEYRVVTDDVASAPPGQEADRRGIAGGLAVFKAAGAAAATGAGLAEVVRAAELANARTRTLGVAFDGCTMPGTTEPLFTVPPGRVGLGVGIHGEPGIGELPVPTASGLAAELVGRLLAERPAGAGTRAAVLLNGLGRTGQEELFLLWAAVRRELAAHGVVPVAPEVGDLVTSLDMAGCSLTLTWLDDELEEWWLAPVRTPAFRRGTPPGRQDEPTAAVPAERTPAPDAAPRPSTPRPPAPPHTPVVFDDRDRDEAPHVVGALRAARTVLAEHEAELARLDAVAGDGDHGRGMVRGASAAADAATAAADAGAGAAAALAAAGQAWADRAGGTSGVLWGAALQAAADVLAERPAPPDGVRTARAVQRAVAAVADLGGAVAGDKTMLDAALPFADALRNAVDHGRSPDEAWRAAARIAEQAAEATAALRPRIGRARPLADRSVGTPDPGAVSLALLVAAVVPGGGAR